MYSQVKSSSPDTQVKNELISSPPEKQVTPWGIKQVHPKVGQLIEETSNVKVAVLDSGIYKDHEDLIGIVKKQYNAISPDTPVIDEFGHGTAIAGILSAANNDSGVIGINPAIEIYDVKVLDSNGKGNVEYLIRGIEWSINQKVHIINISSGITKDSPELKNVIDKAISTGIIVVAAAGNTFGTGVEYPAKYKDVISVNSIKEDFKRPGTAARGKIDYIAPGEKVLSTDHNGGYSLFSGTSFAAAHATGVISLFISNQTIEDTPISEVMALLNEKAVKDKKFVDEIEYGNGLITFN